MRWFIHLSLSGWLAIFLIAATGCQDSGNATVAQTDAPHSDHDHDHDHGEEAHGGEHQHAETFDEAVTELLAMQEAIAEAFAADNAGDAHGPLHSVGHLLEETEALVEKSDMDDDTKQKLREAIEQLFTSYGAVDDKMHDEETGKDYSDVAEQIENAISALKAQLKVSKE